LQAVLLEGEEDFAGRVGGGSDAWEKQVFSARGLKRVGRQSEYAI
jgi:hypothetical protein